MIFKFLGCLVKEKIKFKVSASFFEILLLLKIVLKAATDFHRRLLESKNKHPEE
jgi:hypothetical protein